MGMFDHLRCHYPLPVPTVQACEFQTKSLDCLLNHYVLRADGTLWHTEPVPEDAGDEATGATPTAGTRQARRWREVPVDFSGDVRFYTDYGPRNDRGWGLGRAVFEAQLEHGRLTALVLIAHTEPPEVVARREHATLDGLMPQAAGRSAAARL